MTHYVVAGKVGDVWPARVRVGVAYDRHDALNNEAVYARHYKNIWLQSPSYTIHTCF